MVERIIAIDSGKHSTKLAIERADGSITKKSIRTKMDETDLNTPYTTESYVVGYNGKIYLVGDEAETLSFNLTKAEEIHKVATYASIASVIDNGDFIHLVVGCPLSVFINAEQRQKYLDYIAPAGKQISLSLNGSERHFTIKSSMALPESSGVIYSNTAKYKNSIIGVIDIGGLNANCCIYRNLAPVASSMFTTNLGSNVMMEDLKKKLESKLGMDPITDLMMEKHLQDGFVRSHKEESMQIISEYKETHIQKLIAECKKKQWDLANMDIAFIGGTSLYLKDQIIKEFPYTEEDWFSEDAAYLNVLGFLKVLSAQVKKRK